MASSSISGTQSPPLEATGSHIPMGVSSIDGYCSKGMKDIEQRAEYFSDAAKEHFSSLGHGKTESPESPESPEKESTEQKETEKK